MSDAIVRYVFDRIPALAALRGGAKLDAEEVICNALDDAIDDAIEEHLAFDIERPEVDAT